MGTLSSDRLEAEQRGPEFALTISLSSLRPTILTFAMLIADSMKRGFDVSLENVNENHEENLLKVPE